MMCGLAAYYMTSGRSISASLFEEMTHSMRHRGEDDYGLCFANPEGTHFWRDGETPPPMHSPGVAMGHRRMSIFDLTTAGRQPFVSKNGRFTMVFNGEIYNYVELAEELGREGVRFTTDCDTEVLLEAFVQWGPGCFPKLNGVWAVVVWDRQERNLLVARDRLGEKPLFYTQVGGDWLFSSEVKPLLWHPDVVARPNPDAVRQFLATGHSPLGEETFYASISKLDAGCYAVFRDGHMASKTRFWELEPTATDRRTDLREAADQLDHLLTDAVRVRLRGDLRVGSMLSGGMDSTSVITAITTVLKDHLRESRSVGDSLQAFTASFPGLDNDETDTVEELCRSIAIAAHKIYPVEQVDVEARLREISRMLEAPFWSPAVIVQDALMKLVRTTNVRVVLDGMGSDEIFGGFDWYFTLMVRQALGRGQLLEAGKVLAGMRGLHGMNPAKELVRAILPRDFPEWLDQAKRVLGGKGAQWYSGLFNGPLPSRRVSDYPLNGRTLLDRAMRDALIVDNVPRWAHMVDNVSMANQIVCRSPFLDYRIVQFAFDLDDRLKSHYGVGKYVLREARRGQLPASIVDDVRKVQLQGPTRKWLAGPLSGTLDAIRDGKDAALTQFVRPDALRRVIDGFRAGADVPAPAVWRIVNTDTWMRAFF